MAVGDLNPTLLELVVPAGKYATTGTAIVRNAAVDPAFVVCQTRHPSGDFDFAMTRLASTGHARRAEAAAAGGGAPPQACVHASGGV